jgi:hypothetical protein
LGLNTRPPPAGKRHSVRNYYKSKLCILPKYYLPLRHLNKEGADSSPHAHFTDEKMLIWGG